MRSREVSLKLPESVIAIVNATECADINAAAASILGALSLIAVEIHKTATAEEYQAFAFNLAGNIAALMHIATSDNPPATYEEHYDEYKRSMN